MVVSASYTPSSIGGYKEGVGTLRAYGGDIGGGSENLIAARMVAFGEYAVDGTASAMKARDYKDATDLVAQPIPFDTTQITSPQNGNNPKSGDPCHPLAAGAHPPAITQAMAVRRLTPIECERLQGFPDNYTKIADKTPDGSRYKALGNSWAVPVVRWIGERIARAIP
jgi:DNA (cytosine-5)-methyltransferase 1